MTRAAMEAAPRSGAVPDIDPLVDTAYRSVRRLGEGGMGEVIEAEHRTLGHRVAVKLLREHLVARFELKDRMRLEAQASAWIRHDNLIQVTDFGETYDGRAFLVMDLLHGCALDEEIQKRGFLPMAEALDIARQALAGLAAAHAAGLVHRDVKPDNLFLCDMPGGGPRRVKVLDFGIAKIVDAANPGAPAPLALPTAEGMTVGTPRYASPEQARGERDIDARTDIYSMGWVLFTMLTGRAPFDHLEKAGDLSRAHHGEAPPLPSAVAPQPLPPELDTAVSKALAKRREGRFPSADAFRVELERIATLKRSATSVPRAWTATERMEPQPAPASRAAVSQPARVSVSADPRVGPGVTVDTLEPAITRPPIPWTRHPSQAAPSLPVAPSRKPRRRGPPAWFVAAMVLGILGTVAVVVLRVLRVW